MPALSAKLKREWIKALAKVGLRRVKSNYLGMPLEVPVVYGMVNSGYLIPAEFWMGQCLEAFLNTRGGTVVDVGVNAGLYLVKLRQLSPDRAYAGFEPNPSCNLYTQELIRLNRFSNARLYPIALSDGYGSARFYATQIGDKTGSLVYEHKANEPLEHSFDVITMTADQLFPALEIDEICVIKIDVEEAELQVLHGLDSTISTKRPYIYCEILHSKDDDRRRARAHEIYSLITSYDYLVYGREQGTSSVRLVAEPDDLGEQFEQEYIFCPSELRDRFIGELERTTAATKVY